MILSKVCHLDLILIQNSFSNVLNTSLGDVFLDVGAGNRSARRISGNVHQKNRGVLSE